MRRRQAEAVVEERGPVPDGHREPADGRADGLAGVEGRVVQVGVVAHELSPGHALRRHGPVPEQGAQVAAAGAVEDVHGGEGQPILGRRHDAGLVLAVEGVCAVGGGIRVGSRLRCPERTESGGDRCSAERQAGPRQAETTEQPATAQRCGEGGGVGCHAQETCPDIFDNASAKAWTLADSTRRWGSSTWEYST